MILEPTEASAQAAAHSHLPRVWREAGREGRYVRIQGSRLGIMLTCIVSFMAITPIVSEREGLQ
jgi:hypothetical protein